MFARIKSSGGSASGRNFLIEILMIVVGINIALWFEGWFEDQNDKQQERQYLVGLRADLRTDLKLLDDVIESSTNRMKSLEDAIPDLRQLAKQSAEVQTNTIYLPSSYWFFKPADFTYRSMQESGDFHLLSDDEIKKELLRLIRIYRGIDELQVNFLQALDDEYIPVMMRKYDLVEGRISDPSIAEDQVFLNFFPYTSRDSAQRNEAYTAARARAEALVAAITEQLGDDPD